MTLGNGDTGNVMQPPGAWGPYVPRSRRNLRMRIPRTPDHIFPEPQPMHVPDWGHIGVTPNGALISLGSAADDALGMLDTVGTRGAAVIGAGVGLVLSTNRILGAGIGAGLGYLAGRYLATIIKTTIAAQKVVDVATKAG
jgi:hypothetical protein